MKFIRHPAAIPKHWEGCVMTIGNFDGLHLGHQALITQCRVLAKSLQCPSVVMTFEPYPSSFFKQAAQPRLMSFQEKYQRMKSLGVDALYTQTFSQHFASINAEAFVNDILIEAFQVKGLVIGDDFRFGANRDGDFATLCEMLTPKGVQIDTVTQTNYQQDRISSSRIRSVLADGELDAAAAMLGKAYRLQGKIIHGDKRGRTLGYPTANLLLKHKRLALSGIFLVEVHGIDQSIFFGVASVGRRPMYPGEHDHCEVYLLDFDQDIYDKTITVIFRQKLRDEKNFSSEKALITQMDKDITMAKRLL